MKLSKVKWYKHQKLESIILNQSAFIRAKLLVGVLQLRGPVLACSICLIGLCLKFRNCFSYSAAQAVSRSNIPKQSAIKKTKLFSSSKKTDALKLGLNQKAEVSRKNPLKELSVKLFTFKGPHIKKYFNSGTDESEMEVIGKINKKKRALRNEFRRRRRSLDEEEPTRELKRYKRGDALDRRR